jgi:hypothetical protein
MSMKNSNDIIGNRTRDLTTCSAVPQPTAPPRAAFKLVRGMNLLFILEQAVHIFFAINLKKKTHLG